MLWGMGYYPKTVQLHTTLYVGGGGSASVSECTVLQYECTTDSWSKLPEYQYYYFGMSLINGRHLTLVGGKDRHTLKETNKLGVWDPSSQQWTQPYPPMITPRCFPEVATYNNYLLAAGGYDGSRDLATVEVLHVGASEQWLTATQLPVPCYLKTAYTTTGTSSLTVNKSCIPPSLNSVAPHKLLPCPPLTRHPHNGVVFVTHRWNALPPLPSTDLY